MTREELVADEHPGDQQAQQGVDDRRDDRSAECDHVGGAGPPPVQTACPDELGPSETGGFTRHAIGGVRGRVRVHQRVAQTQVKARQNRAGWP